MQLERARIKNFRSLRDIEVSFGAHTALIGGNGAGKSSILKAIEKASPRNFCHITSLTDPLHALVRMTG